MSILLQMQAQQVAHQQEMRTFITQSLAELRTHIDTSLTEMRSTLTANVTWLADEVNWTADQVDLILSIGRYAATRPRPSFPDPGAGPSHAADTDP